MANGPKDFDFDYVALVYVSSITNCEPRQESASRINLFSMAKWYSPMFYTNKIKKGWRWIWKLKETTSVSQSAPNQVLARSFPVKPVWPVEIEAFGPTIGSKILHIMCSQCNLCLTVGSLATLASWGKFCTCTFGIWSTLTQLNLIRQIYYLCYNSYWWLTCVW